MNPDKSLIILVPTDFSDTSKIGMQVASSISEKVPCEIHLIHWVEPPTDVYLKSSGEIHSSASQMQDVFTLKLIQKRRQELKQWQKQFGKPNLKLLVKLKQNDFQSGLNKQAEEIGADLIVMGTSGEHAFDELFKGNHAEKAVRVAPCPVLTVKRVPENLDFKNLLLVIDMSDQHQAVSKVVKLGRLLGSSIHLAFINSSIIDNKKEALMQMKLVALRHGIKKYTLNYASNVEQLEGIISLAQIKGADLIAVFTKNHSLLTELFAADRAEDLINETNRPVLTINVDELTEEKQILN